LDGAEDETRKSLWPWTALWLSCAARLREPELRVGVLYGVGGARKADETLRAATDMLKAAAHSGLLRKLAVRLVARVGLTYLPPRVAAWRYQVRG